MSCLEIRKVDLRLHSICQFKKRSASGLIYESCMTNFFRMPVLDAKFFQGSDPIPPDILSKLFVGGPTRVNEMDAAQLGWDGKLAGGIVLQLSEYGSLARRGAFTLLGQLADQPIVIPAFKIWDKASKDLTATITLPKAEDFSFLDGGLCSDYIDEDEIQFAITKGHTPVLPPQYRQHKITGLAAAHAGSPLQRLQRQRRPRHQADVARLPTEC